MNGIPSIKYPLNRPCCTQKLFYMLSCIWCGAGVAWQSCLLYIQTCLWSKPGCQIWDMSKCQVLQTCLWTKPDYQFILCVTMNVIMSCIKTHVSPCIDISCVVINPRSFQYFFKSWRKTTLGGVEKGGLSWGGPEASPQLPPPPP